MSDAELFKEVVECVHSLNIKGYKINVTDTKVIGLQKVCFKS